MTKILLTAINAKYIHSNLAVYNLRASAGEYKKNTALAEFTINQKSDYILEEIYKENPDVLCFSCYIWNFEYVKEIAREFHKLKPEVPIWVGGPEVSYETENLFAENPYFFGVMIGEGEAVFAELAAHYCGGKPTLEEIKGIAYRIKTNPTNEKNQTAETIHRTALRTPIDLSNVPFCYENMDDFKNKIIYYESSRGCPFSCSYCLSSVDKKLRFRDMALVKKELLFFLEQEVPQVKFVDRTFNCNHERAMEIWSFLLEHDTGKTNFHFEIAADLLTEEELSLLGKMRSGLVQLEIGVQSVNPVTIKEIHRTMKLDDVKRAVKRIQSFGNIHEHLDLIAGLPYEDYESFAHSFCEIYKLKPNQLQLGFLKVLKGSYLYEHRDEYGIIYRSKPPYEVMETTWLSYEEILKIKLVEEMTEVYYNSGQFEVTMKLIDVLYPDSFAFFLALGQYYEKKGYRNMNHSRIRRCEILLEFLKQDFRNIGKEAEKEEITDRIEQSLVFDLYYRENCKSRPSWAKNLSEFSGISKYFCKTGKLTHLEPFDYHFPKKEEKSIYALPEKTDEPVYIIFDYENRDYLDNQASVRELTGKEKEEWEKERKKS